MRRHEFIDVADFNVSASTIYPVGGSEQVNHDRYGLWTFSFIDSDVVGGQYRNLYPTVKDVYLKLVSLGLRALVYNGDTDMACNFMGSQWFVEHLGLEVGTFISGKPITMLKTTSGYTFWYYCKWTLFSGDR